MCDILVMLTLHDYIMDQGWTQADAAASIGISRSYLAEILSGAKQPGRATIDKIVTATRGAVPAVVWFQPAPSPDEAV